MMSKISSRAVCQRIRASESAAEVRQIVVEVLQDNPSLFINVNQTFQDMTKQISQSLEGIQTGTYKDPTFDDIDQLISLRRITMVASEWMINHQAGTGVTNPEHTRGD